MTNDHLLHLSSWLFALGLFLAGVGGAFLPWIWRESVALQLTAPGLAEYVKFLAEVRTLQLQLARLRFLYPLFLVMLSIPLLIEQKSLQLSHWVRWGLRLAVFPLALASLSPVWDPDTLLTPEFRGQTLLALLAMSLAVIAPLLNKPTNKVKILFRLEMLLFILTAVAAIIFAWQQFNLVQPAISATYNGPVVLGWGWWVTVGGLGLSVGGSIGLLLTDSRR